MEPIMSYERNDMIYHDYTWTPQEDKVQVTAVDTFQPENGNTVLNFINSLTSNLFDGTILEIIIHDLVPQTVKTVKQAYEWIKEQGDHYYKVVLRSIAQSK
jgi:hypothetical protein